MARLPPKPRDDLSEEQQKVHDSFIQIADKSFGPGNFEFSNLTEPCLALWQGLTLMLLQANRLFKYEETNGAQVGPMPFYMYFPKIGSANVDLVMSMASAPLSPDARETAIITVTAKFQAGYALHSHMEIAADPGYLSREQLGLIRKGTKPSGLNDGCSIAYDVAHRLASTPGPMPQELWDRAISVFGKDSTVALIHYVGYYSYVSMFMNACDVRVPEWS